MFALQFNYVTNTLEIYDLKPGANFNTKNPSSHYVNHFMQLIAYALTVQKELGGEVNIRCIVFNEKGFVQFNPHLMYFEMLNFLTNLEGSSWNKFVEAYVKGIEAALGDDYRKGYSDYQNIKPTKAFMKAFIDLYPFTSKTELWYHFTIGPHKRMLESTSQYLEHVEKLLNQFSSEVQEDYDKEDN